MLKSNLDFIYGYLIIRSYFFRIRTNVDSVDYPNRDYVRVWREFLKDVDYGVLLKRAMDLISVKPSSDCLNLCDCLDRSSYFALISKTHPSITLGFVKDADLWDLWLREGVYKLAREEIGKEISSGDRVIDFGCGSISPEFYGELVGPGGWYTGIDFSKPLLSIARVRVRDRNLDWVELMQGYVDSRLDLRGEYDLAICSSILQYANYRGVLLNAIKALNGEGTIIIFSEVFPDLEPDKAKLFNIYYSLIPHFKGFPKLSEIVDFVSKHRDCTYKIKNNILKIYVH